MTIANTNNKITIEGNIKSISDFHEIKSVMDEVITRSKEIEILVKDSFSITSSVIGYFNKIIHKDGVTLHLSVTDKRLYELLEDLNLIALFHVKKV